MRLEAKELDAALAQAGLKELRVICVALTLGGLFAFALPFVFQHFMPKALPPYDDEAASLDLSFGLALSAQALCFAGIFIVQRHWSYFAERRPEPGEPWGPALLAPALRRICILRFALGEATCLTGGLALYLAYQKGLLVAAPRLGLLALLPLLALYWMLLNWPDEARLRRAFLRS